MTLILCTALLIWPSLYLGPIVPAAAWWLSLVDAALRAAAGTAVARQPGYRHAHPDQCCQTRFTAKPAWVRHEVLRLKALMPGSGCRKIADAFNRRFAAHVNPQRRASVCSSTVAAWIKANLCQIAALRRAIKHRVPHTLPRNQVWAIDLTGKGDIAGGLHTIFGIADHGTRACLLLEAVKNKASITLLRALLDTIEKFGKPKSIRTDNEAVFTSRLFRFGLWWLGIKHQRSALSSPWMNGRVERFFGTLKHSLDQLAVDGHDALNAALADFRFFYNHVRSHQHLAGLTPAEVWSGLRWRINSEAGSNPHAITKRAAAIAALPPVQEEFWFEAWDGLLTGYYLRR